MANLSKFDKENVAELRAAMNKALAEVQKDFGVKIDIGNISFNEKSFKSQLTVAAATDNPYLVDVQPAIINNLTKYREYKDGLGRTVNFRGSKFVVVGLRGNNFLAKKEGQPAGPIFKLAYDLFDELDAQMRK